MTLKPHTLQNLPSYTYQEYEKKIKIIPKHCLFNQDLIFQSFKIPLQKLAQPEIKDLQSLISSEEYSLSKTPTMKPPRFSLQEKPVNRKFR